MYLTHLASIQNKLLISTWLMKSKATNDIWRLTLKMMEEIQKQGERKREKRKE